MSQRLGGKGFAGDVLYAFCGLAIVFIPVVNEVLPAQANWANAIFGSLIHFLNQKFSNHSAAGRISSDSTAMYWLFLLLFLLAIAVRTALIFLPDWKAKRPAVLSFLRTVFAYYLAFRLMEYGVGKLSGRQFYTPEPNILYTPFGYLDRDILYWSVMGLSPAYHCFLGLTEMLAALLLLFRRTRVLGLFVALVVLVNIVAVNFAFDISVKLYSLFLLFLCLIGLAPQGGRLYRFFVAHAAVSLAQEPTLLIKPFLKNALKIFALGFIVLNVFYPVLTADRLTNDDETHPFLHGAFEVKAAHLEADTTPLPPPYRRLFIHRSGYLIFQSADDKMKDFKLYVDTTRRTFSLTDYEGRHSTIAYVYQDSLLQLHFLSSPRPYFLETKLLNWKRLPALRPSFHWTEEGNEDAGQGQQ